MSLVKFLFASTAVGAVVATAPLAFEIGKFYGRKDAQKQDLQQEALAKTEGASRVPLYKHKSVATPWSNRS